MPFQKEFSKYDPRLFKLLDRAVLEPVIIRRKFDRFGQADTFRRMLYQVRWAGRKEDPPITTWDALHFKITSDFCLIIGTEKSPSVHLDDIIGDLDLD